MSFIAVIFTLLAIVIVYFIYKEKRLQRILRGFTCPPKHPVFGHLLYFIYDEALLPNLLNLTLKYGGLLRFSVLHTISANFVSDPAFLRYLLGTNAILNKPEDYDFLKRWLGSGLLISKRVKWEKTRKLLNPAFHVQILESYFDVFNSMSDVLIQKLSNELGKDSFDVYPYVTLCTLDVICETAMGTKLDAQDGKHSDYVECVQEMGRIIIHRARTPLKSIFLFYVFSRDYWKERRALKILHALTNSVIRARKAELSGKSPQPIKKKLSFLDLLLEVKLDGRPMTDEEIRMEVDTFMFAGHDTTAAAITFTLHCLAVNPEAQKRAFEEQHDLYGSDKTKHVTSKALQDMPYLDMIIKESLRLYPPVPIYGRSPEDDTPFGGFQTDVKEGVMPKNMATFVFAYGLHRNPLYFPEPEKFQPERFQSADNQLPYTYIPFSAGARSCIGQKFALHEMKVVLSKILRNFELLPVEGFAPKLVAWTVLRSLNGVRIGLRERH